MTDIKRDWYRMHDVDNRGAVRIEGDGGARRAQALEWNRKGFGIFWTLNQFNGPRQIANLTQIHAWAVDIDAGTKEDMRAKLRGSPLVPSFVVETRRGYQAYWNAKDAKPEHWNALVLERLVPYFGADKNARDLARILRVPGYLHQKDPTAPFLVRAVHALEVAYTERQLAESFPVYVDPARSVETRQHVKREVRFSGSDGFWDAVYNLDCEEGLSRLSGHPAVRGEHYTFRRVRNGHLNIIVDGKGTSCFIDRHGRIGSLDNGGPTLAQWLKWYGCTYAEAAKIIKQLFPQLDRQAA